MSHRCADDSLLPKAGIAVPVTPISIFLNIISGVTARMTAGSASAGGFGLSAALASRAVTGGAVRGEQLLSLFRLERSARQIDGRVTPEALRESFFQRIQRRGRRLSLRGGDDRVEQYH